VRVLYGIQCTGNGHITRSINIINELRKHVTVDVVTSGSHSEVPIPFTVKYRLSGLSYYFGKNGSYDFWRTLTKNNVFRFIREVRKIPIQKYDLVVSDFEPITSWAAMRNDVFCAHVSNQAALLNKKVPKQLIINPFAKLMLRYFCPADKRYGLFYQKYGDQTFFPPIRDEVKGLSVADHGYYVVYLPFYSDERIVDELAKFSEVKWKVYSKHTTAKYVKDNIEVYPISGKFTKDMALASGVLCSAGFGTTAEALYLGKKLFVIPMRNQFEQQCNAYALEKLGVRSCKSLTNGSDSIAAWLADDTIPTVRIKDDVRRLTQQILTDYINDHGARQLEFSS